MCKSSLLLTPLCKSSPCSRFHVQVFAPAHTAVLVFALLALPCASLRSARRLLSASPFPDASPWELVSIDFLTNYYFSNHLILIVALCLCLLFILTSFTLLPYLDPFTRLCSLWPSDGVLSSSLRLALRRLCPLSAAVRGLAALLLLACWSALLFAYAATSLFRSVTASSLAV